VSGADGMVGYSLCALSAKLDIIDRPKDDLVTVLVLYRDPTDNWLIQSR